MQKTGRCHRHSDNKAGSIAVLLIGIAACITIMFNNTLFFPALFHLYSFETEGKDSTLDTHLIYGSDGYTVSVSGEGAMSDYSPAEWQNNFKTVSAGWKIRIKKAEIKEGISSLSSSLFAGCSALHEVYLPKTLQTIGDSAFAYCNNLKQIHFAGTVEQWESLEADSPGWNRESSISAVACSDGICNISEQSTPHN